MWEDDVDGVENALYVDVKDTCHIALVGKIASTYCSLRGHRDSRSYSTSVTVSESFFLYVHPALFTRMSKVPNVDLVFSKAFLQSSSLVTSVFANTACPPTAAISFAILRDRLDQCSFRKCHWRVAGHMYLSPPASLMSASTILAPSSAKSFAMPSPKPVHRRTESVRRYRKHSVFNVPLAAPVTSATLP